MNETPIMNRIKYVISQIPGVRVFRNNVGVAKYGPACKICKHNSRWVKYGLFEGSSDLIGWKTVIITPEMVGHEMAVFTAVEVKRPGGKPAPEQRNFIDRVKQAGGIAGIVKSEEDARILMNDKNWGFALGELGDPLADIKDCMLPPFSEKDLQKHKELNPDITL